jgi:predicted NBD/HSP70 family sugar kinase
LASSRKRTKAEQGPSPVIDRIVEGVEESVAAADYREQIKGVGVGSPGRWT